MTILYFLPLNFLLQFQLIWLLLYRLFPVSTINVGSKKLILCEFILIMILNTCYYYYSQLESPVHGWERVRTLSVKPHTTNQWKEEKDKTVRDKKERADHANRKALALHLKPHNRTPSNTGSLRSFQRDTERGTKLLRY